MHYFDKLTKTSLQTWQRGLSYRLPIGTMGQRVEPLASLASLQPLTPPPVCWKDVETPQITIQLLSQLQIKDIALQTIKNPLKNVKFMQSVVQKVSNP